MARSDAPGLHGDLFWDDFSRPSDKWQDMRVWGFGAWQVKDGTFVSLDDKTPEQTIYAAAPRFAQALVNRDYSVVFHYRPVAGAYYLFSLNVRQHGWDCYKFEVDGSGVVRIAKAKIGQMPEVLAASSPGAAKFGQWQWVRFDVRGDRPLLLRAKLWQGAHKDEPPLYDVVARDEVPLPPAQLSLALNMVRQGGAHTAVDDFCVRASVAASPVWRWAKLKGAGRAHRHFAHGRVWAAEQGLQGLLARGQVSWALYNNLGLVAAEKGHFADALRWLAKGYKLAPGQEVVRANVVAAWSALAHDGLLKEAPPEQESGLIVKTDRAVYAAAEPGQVRCWLLTPALGGPKCDSLRLTFQDSSGQVVWRAGCPVTLGAQLFAHASLDFEPTKIADGAYRAVLSGGGKETTAQFEVACSAFRALQEEVAAVKRRVAEGRRTSEVVHQNDWANVEAALLPVERALQQAHVPGGLRRRQAETAAALAQAEAALAALQAGRNPWRNATGTFLRGYYSEIDGSLQGYALHVPDSYSGERPFPLVVNLHGYDPSFADWRDNPFLPGFIPEATQGGRFIVVNPFGRGNTMYQDIGEQDVLSVLAEVQRLYVIDPDRVYLTGGSMGGGGAWYLGLRHPDLFAAIAPVMGPTDYGFWLGVDSASASPLQRYLLARNSPLSYAENARNLAARCVHGAKDDIVPVEQSRRMAARFRQLGYPLVYTEYPEAAHGGFPAQMEKGRYDWLAEQTRPRWPRQVIYKTADLNHPGAYWVRIERFEHLLDFATIEAEIAEQNRITVRTHNVSRFRLEVPRVHCEPDLPIQVAVDGDVCDSGEIPPRGLLCFRRAEDGQWLRCSSEEGCAAGKRPGLAGPISDAFNGGFLLVYGTVGRRQENAAAKGEAEAFAEQWQRWQHVSCRVKADRQVTVEDIRNFHLILIGGPYCNLLTERIHGELPIQFRRNGVQVGERRFSGEDVGAALVYPNPLNPGRYVVVLAGVSWRAVTGLLKRIGTEFDYVVFDARTVGRHALQGTMTVEGTALLCGFFDQDWQLDKQYQWPADERVREGIVPRTIPEQTEPDTCRGAFCLSDLVPEGVEQWIGAPERDRTFWGTPLQGPAGATKGIGVYPNSRIRFRLDGRWRYFTARLCVDLPPSLQTAQGRAQQERVQFAMYGDGEELFVSKLMTARSQPVAVRVPIFGVRELDLVVGTTAWLPGSPLGASWVDAKVEGR
ncbi:MAG: NPCBM/NEW2 domain-containing protein [bacterium]|nr:NPCBM/NEW2 domain-containing protein [candidate division KSB1 bacterium]MDH7560305.1 NPCBM/NEW2 domain-containing protein [bacterium]